MPDVGLATPCRERIRGSWSRHIREINATRIGTPNQELSGTLHRCPLGPKHLRFETISKLGRARKSSKKDGA